MLNRSSLKHLPIPLYRVQSFLVRVSELSADSVLVSALLDHHLWYLWPFPLHSIYVSFWLIASVYMEFWSPQLGVFLYGTLIAAAMKILIASATWDLCRLSWSPSTPWNFWSPSATRDLIASAMWDFGRRHN